MTGRGRERGNAIEEEESEREKRGASTSSSPSFLSLSQPQPKLTKKKHALSHTRTLPELTKKPVDGFSAGLVGDSLSLPPSKIQIHVEALRDVARIVSFPLPAELHLVDPVVV